MWRLSREIDVYIYIVVYVYILYA